jgi:hypothetical protein
MLDTLREVELDEIEAVSRICGGVAVEVPVATNQSPAQPESAMLDRAPNAMTKPRPQLRPTPAREKRGKRRPTQ